jgi:hypothetical protein
MGKTITIEEDQLKELIASEVAKRKPEVASADTATVVAEAIKQVFGISKDGNTEEQRIHALNGTALPERKLLAQTLVPCRNPRNGATFTAVVAPSREFPEGRTVRLIDYKYPDDLEQRARKAGWTPEKTFKASGSARDYGGQNRLDFHMGSMTSPGYMQWRYENYLKADMAAFQGQTALMLPKCGDPSEWKPDGYARSVSVAQGIVSGPID